MPNRPRSESTGTNKQDILRTAVHEYYRDRDLKDGINERIDELERRVDEIDDEIDNHRTAISDLKDERHELRNKLESLREKRAEHEDAIATVDEAVDELAAVAIEKRKNGERLDPAMQAVKQYAHQFDERPIDIVEQVYVEHPEVPRTALSRDIDENRDRALGEWSEAVVRIGEYVEQDEDGAESRRVFAMIRGGGRV